ncbi:9571_t:CDS:2 [Scutellospora calospora]|uniref:9571_t:CDS:1 n=1 Tax=Scutellospora calospora TaxID=85575 RepID=A0ACA9KF17_9GLOM|nr:9571_t:CDS:2 [Scutellospora calospora]
MNTISGAESIVKKATKLLLQLNLFRKTSNLIFSSRLPTKPFS